MYENKMSVSVQKSPEHGNYTYGFAVKNIDGFEDIASGGFTSSVFSGSHRKSEFLVGMTNLGYVDIDAGFEPLYKSEDLERICKKNAWGLSRSGSQKQGKFRIIFKRGVEVVTQKNRAIALGFEMEMFSIEKEYISGLVRYILQAELEYFCEVLPGGNVKNIDITSANPAMHSKELGEVLVEFESEKMPEMSLELYDFTKVTRGLSAGNIKVNLATENGRVGAFSVKSGGGKECIEMTAGNCLKARVNGLVIDVGLMDCVQKGLHLLDPLEGSDYNPSLRCSDDDAYMPFIMSIWEAPDGFSNRLYLNAYGQHNRNYGGISTISVMFVEDIASRLDKKYTSLIVYKGEKYAIDEVNRRYFRIGKEGKK